MKVSNLQPNAAIGDHVQRILVIEDCQVTNPFTLPLFANGSPTLLFQTTKGTIKEGPSNHLVLFGQTVFPTTLTIRNDFTLIAYFFQPSALYALFGVSAQELTDHPIALNLLSSKMTAELQDKLLNAPSTTARIGLLDNYILSLTVRNRTGSELIAYAARKLAGAAFKESLAAVHNELHLTERTFQRLFKDHIGIAPNLYRRICQFDAAFRQLNSGRFSKLSEIAFENGYADQSHYIRTFKEFTRITPKDYLKGGSQN